MFGSCTGRVYDFELDEKWVLLSTEINGIEIRDKIMHDPLLSYTLRDKKYYPAVRFHNSDSNVVVPGTNGTKEILYYSTNKKLKNISFYRKDNSDSESFVDQIFLHNFSIEKDEKQGELILQSENIKIRMMPSERFALRVKAMELD